jgi:hypothetical protein
MLSLSFFAWIVLLSSGSTIRPNWELGVIRERFQRVTKLRCRSPYFLPTLAKFLVVGSHELKADGADKVEADPKTSDNDNQPLLYSDWRTR